MPDNIRYDGQGLYWIAFATVLITIFNYKLTLPITCLLNSVSLCNELQELTPSWELALKYPFIRKIVAMVLRYFDRPNMERNGGVFAVDLEGKPVYHYHDPGLSLVSTGIKIGDHLYCGSVVSPFILRLNLLQYPARPTT